VFREAPRSKAEWVKHSASFFRDTITRMKPLGKIIRLQIQRSRLKLGEKPNQYYDPSALVAVDELRLTPKGAFAIVNGETILDVHHTDHPHTRNNDGVNDLSIGFTSHYEAMRARYGDHLFNGCAGENILVAMDSRVDLTRIQNGLIIGDAAFAVRLNDLRVALPCAPFSKFASKSSDPQAVKGALQFLDHGMRGFYCVVNQEATIKVGDEVAVG
jgi:hypothetical protein